MEPTRELIELKNKQRLALKREYLKRFTDPNAGEVGHVFDPGFQRYLGMKSARIDYFRETPKSSLYGLALIVIPAAATIWMIKNDRDKKEALYRSGKVAYKDRDFKFQ